MAKLTDWYPPQIKPVHEGWYDTGAAGNRSYWNGHYWSAPKGFFMLAKQIQDICWRGIAK